MPKYRVALVVFATAEGADEGDAIDAASIAVRRAFGTATGDTRLRRTFALPFGPHPDPEIAAQVIDVVDVHEAGSALRNGYLTAGPTGTAWSQYGHEDPGPAWKVDQQG